MRISNREEVATLIFQGVTERVIIGQEENGQWSMYYLHANGSLGAEIRGGGSREQILAVAKDFMMGHGRALIENLIQSSELYLGSMGAVP